MSQYINNDDKSETVLINKRTNEEDSNEVISTAYQYNVKVLEY